MNESASFYVNLIKEQLNIDEIEQLEAGTFGQSFKFKRKQTKNYEIVKVVKGIFNDSLDINLYVRQLERLAVLRHPLLLPFSGLFVSEKETFKPIVISQFIEEGNLDNVLRNYKLTATQKSILLAGVASAFAYLEEHEISHFTLNPNNILFNDKIEPIISGYGIGFIASKGGYIPTEWYKEYSFYFAPEPYKTQKSDIYSFAVLCYHIITGKQPDKNFTLPFNMLSSYKRLFGEIIDCSAPFRLPFHAICNRFATGELVLPGTKLNLFNKFLQKCMIIEPIHKELRAKAYNLNLQAMLELIPLVNDNEAIYLAYEASTRNDTKALCYLGKCYEEGKGILKDKDMAMKYYEIAKDKGDLNGLFNFGRLLYETNKEEGLKILKEAADKGLVESSLKYADLTNDKRYYDVAYLNLKGVHKKDLIKQYSSYYLELKYCQDISANSLKIKQMEEYALNGNDIAAYELATILTNQPEKALSFYKIAADSGNKNALFRIGTLYKEGIYVKKDPNMAYLYFKKALNAKGEFNSEACEYFKNYRDFGHVNECFLYGYCQYNGEGCKKNEEKGIATIERSIELGSFDGSFYLKKIEWDEAMKNIQQKRDELQKMKQEKQKENEDADDKDPPSEAYFNGNEERNDQIEEDSKEYFKEEEDNEEINLLKKELKEKVKKEASELAEEGSVDAALFCGRIFQNGDYYLDKDDVLSLHFYKIASYLNDSEGIFHYGVHLLYGTEEESEIG